MKLNIEKLKKEFAIVGVLFVFFLIIAQIVFNKDGFITVLRFVFVFFWLFVLPGMALMYYWHDKIGFGERLIVGIAVSAAVIGILSYYLGLIGIHNKLHGYFLPPVLMLAGFLLAKKKR